MRHFLVKIQNRKTGFTGSQKPVIRFWKTGLWRKWLAI